jgi:hypothetical protein
LLAIWRLRIPALDKIDFDETIDEYGYRAGTPAKLIRTADQVQQARPARKPTGSTGRSYGPSRPRWRGGG